MKKPFYNTAFIWGFACCFCLFLFLNYRSYAVLADDLEREPGYIIGLYEFGFPFEAHYKLIGHPFEFNVLWGGFLANILIALICSLVIGLTFKFISTKIISRTTILK